jgi:glycosyltransferase involved in cell wall biosynthesis
MARAPTVTAIVATYNEEDVIGVVLAELLGQGVRVHLIDQGSTDATVAEARALQGRGDLRIESLDGGDFSLARIIRRKEALAAELDTDWVLNADADEFRESPWPGVGFVEGLREVDRLGYNAVDFAVLNFVPVDDGFRKGDDPREKLRFYEKGPPFDRLQIRCWKKPPGPLDLVSTAGHEARFEGRHVFPIRFLLRHYPIRGQAHGERKVFRERRPRFSAEERARGWHVQYDSLAEGASFLREPSSLTPYDPWRARLDLALRHRGVEALEEELSRCGQALAAREAEIAVRGEELSRRTEELAFCRQELSHAREVVTLLDRELAASREGLKALSHHAEQTRDDLLRGQEVLRAERDAGERRRAALQQRLDAVLASRIWRWTSSLRAGIDALTR